MTRRFLLGLVASCAAWFSIPRPVPAALSSPVPLTGLNHGPLHRLVDPTWKVVALPGGGTSVQLWTVDRVTGEVFGNAVRLEPGHEDKETFARALLNLWAEEEDHRLVAGHDMEACSRDAACPWLKGASC